MLAHYFSYVTLNISCPNAQDGCMFQEPHLLAALLAAIGKEKPTLPIFLKISNHLTVEEADAIIAVADHYPFVTGFVVGNLSKRRETLCLTSPPEILNAIPDGGISGRPVKELSTKLIRHIRQKTNGKYIIIGLGGIFTAEDAYEKIKAGASVVQIITGLIYDGPEVVKKINKGLVELLKRDGYANIGEAVGKEKI
jgi:dihydroorotate dehydrogenase